MLLELTKTKIIGPQISAKTCVTMLAPVSLSVNLAYNYMCQVPVNGPRLRVTSNNQHVTAKETSLT